MDGKKSVVSIKDQDKHKSKPLLPNDKGLDITQKQMMDVYNEGTIDQFDKGK